MIFRCECGCVSVVFNTSELITLTLLEKIFQVGADASISQSLGIEEPASI